MTEVRQIQKMADWLGRRSPVQMRGLLLLAGGVTGFAFAPFYLFPLLAISFPLLLLVLPQAPRLWTAYAYGWYFGFGQFFTGLIWIATAFEVDDRYPAAAGYLAVGGLAILLAIFTGLATAIYWKIFQTKDPKKYALPMALTFVVIWSLSEWLRGHVFTGFPWNLTGYIWGFSDTMLQTTALWGIYGLGVLTLFLALIPYLLIQLPAKSGYRVMGVAVIMIGGMAAYGLAQLSTPTHFNDAVKLKIIQANINQQDKWDPAKKADNFLKYLRMSKSPPAQGITHVIWPETSVVYFLDTDDSRRFLISDILNENSVLMVGYPRVQRSPEFKAWNSLAEIDDEGNVRNIYDKYHLVPFGEYTPDFLSDSLSFLGLGMLVEGFSYSRGEGIRTLHRDGMPPVGVLICYEIIFPGAVVDPKDRPDWLLNITNDAWYGTFSGPYQHLLQTRVRAIEEGLPVIRSAGTGISAVIDSYGRIVKSLSLNKQGVIISNLPVKKNGVTLYSIYGDWIFFILAISFYGLNTLLQRWYIR